MIYQLKITLAYSKPPIWRRLEVDGESTLSLLHYMIQIAMGWENCHLHHFHADGVYYSEPDPEEWGFDDDKQNEEKCTLAQIAPQKGKKFFYEYDFGDSWLHEILVEEIKEPERGGVYPRCTKGKMAGPPEDVGGVFGYYEMLDILEDEDHPDYEMYEGFADNGFDPTFFSLEDINRKLSRLNASSTSRRSFVSILTEATPAKTSSKASNSTKKATASKTSKASSKASASSKKISKMTEKASETSKKTLKPAKKASAPSEKAPKTTKESQVPSSPSYTHTQGQYLAFLYYFMKVTGAVPLQADIQRYFGVTQPAVHHMLKALEEKGLIAMHGTSPKYIRILLPKDELPALE